VPPEPPALVPEVDRAVAVPPLEVSPPTLVLVSDVLVAVAVVPPLPPAELTSFAPGLVAAVTVLVTVSDVTLAPLVVPVLVTSPLLADSGAGWSEAHAPAVNTPNISAPVNNGLNTPSYYYGSRPGPRAN